MAEKLIRQLEQLQFDSRFVEQLPADPEVTKRRRQVMGACYSRVHPTKVVAPRLIAYSREVATLLDLDLTAVESNAFVNVLSGNQLLEGMDPYAMCYGGHQFGNWAGQLGDGRAINLGEVRNRAGEHWTLQLKGAGLTPYSRTADGLAVLRSSIREFLCSEAMFHLGVPTTRALSLIVTGEQVMRDMFYDGNVKSEPGAVVCRVARSFIRFGSFQIFSSRGDVENLQRLVDFTIRNDFPHLGKPSPEVYAKWFEEVCVRTCDMIVHWMRVGFVHGVMNTDNMSILGETIDYGPYGWLEDYDPGWTPNTTDEEGKRYRFGNQPLVAHWNLYQLGNAILPLIDGTEPLQRGLDVYLKRVESESNLMIGQKLGLTSFDSDSDRQLKEELFEILTLVETDMTIFFRRLADLSCDEAPEVNSLSGSVKVSYSDQADQRRKLEDDKLIKCIDDAYYRPEQVAGENRIRIANWMRAYRTRVQSDGTSDVARRERMNRVNPKYVLRNYLAQMAIDRSEAGDDSLVIELLELLRRPYDEQPEKESFAAKRPEWARNRPGCSTLSCSS